MKLDTILLTVILILIGFIIYFLPLLINELGWGCTLDDAHPSKISIEKVEYWVANHNCNNKVVFVIPFYKSESIANYPEWCNELINLSKKYNFEIGLHGYKHEKFGNACREFIVPSLGFFRAYKIYEKAFNKKPLIWRSPCFNLNIIDYIFIKSKNVKNFGFINSGETYHPNNLNKSWCKLHPSWKDFFNRKC